MAIPTKEPMLLDAQDAPATAALPVPVQPADSTALMFERLAKDPSVDVEKLERLIAMQERILKVNAEAAFNAAFSKMQPEIPVIIERGRTDKGTFAELEDIVEIVRPILARHGFALTHQTQWPAPTQVRVIGILTHADGHQRTSEFLSGADTSGSKNAIQALGSAVSYGRRYTTKDLLCIVTRQQDNDGATAEKFKETAPDPDGYDNWKADMEVVAADGLPQLMETWNKSLKAFRQRVSKVDLAWWEGLREKAKRAR